MKVSYSWLKKIVPGLKNMKQAVEAFESHLFEVENFDKKIMDLKILPNRFSDAACHVGLAKEIAAVTGLKLNLPKVKIFGKEKVKRQFEVMVKVPDLCRRMTARYVEGIKIKPSPKWLAEAILEMGLQPINNLVDLTNYVTFEMGQPLHAFDFEKLVGGKIIVRGANEGEEIELLDHKKYVLKKGMAVIADALAPLDVAGIKGGRRAEINHETKNILLVSGNFLGSNIYKTSRLLGLQTDASLRFSHDLAPVLAMEGLDRATDLILEVCGGKVGMTADVNFTKIKPKTIQFSCERFRKLTGIALKDVEILKYLKRLGFSVKGEVVEVPLNRTDINIFPDLVEEVTRLYGYKNLEGAAPLFTLNHANYDDVVNLEDRIREILPHLGLSEVYNHTLVSTNNLKNEVSLLNPPSAESAALRGSLIHGLANNLRMNGRNFESVAIFELGHVFELKEGGVLEKNKLGLAAAAKHEVVTFLKGIVEDLMSGLGIFECEFKISDKNKLEILVDGEVVGFLESEGTSRGKRVVAELDLDELLKLVEEERSFVPIGRFPNVIRDISFEMKNRVSYEEILVLIKKTASEILADLDVLDLYNEAMTLRLVFESSERTLTQAEVDLEINKISKVLVDKFGVVLR